MKRSSVVIITLLLELSSGFTQQPQQSQCISGVKTPKPKYFYHGDEAVNLKILTSSRPSHQIISTILQIFSEEVSGYLLKQKVHGYLIDAIFMFQVLGYANVSLVEITNPTLGFEPDEQFSYISSCTVKE